MANKHKFIVFEIIKGIGKQRILLEYVKETGDPLHDDLPTDLLQPGDTVYVDIPLQEPEQDFNRGI